MNILDLKNKELNKPCVIVCTGPELNKTSPEFINRDKYVTISMNNIWLMKDRFIPDYWMAEDILVLQYNAKQIMDYEGPIKFLPQTFIGGDGYVPFNINYGDNNCLFSTDLTQFIGYGGTVTYPCLQLAWWLGCREVYIIGSGPGWGEVKEQGARILIDNKSHFSPDYYKNQPIQHAPSPDLMRKSFTIANTFYNQNGGKIYDCTPIPIFDIFEKGEWEWLI